jgi:hypothetical protein
VSSRILSRKEGTNSLAKFATEEKANIWEEEEDFGGQEVIATETVLEYD